MRATKMAVALAWAAGAMDLATGLGLVGLPAWTLTAMRVPVPGAEALVFVRFVGAFVGAVGATYLWAARRPAERLRIAFLATMWFRGSAAGYVAAAVLAGWLASGWVTVSATDGALVAAQAWLLAKGAGRRE